MHPALRDMLQETHVSLNDLIYPIFIKEGLDDFTPVESMPGVNRIAEKQLEQAIKEIAGGVFSGGRALFVTKRNFYAANLAYVAKGLSTIMRRANVGDRPAGSTASPSNCQCG